MSPHRPPPSKKNMRSLGISPANPMASLRPTQGVIAEPLGDGLVLLHPDGQYFALSRVGATFWTNCDGRRTIEQISQVVTREFEVQAVEALSDLLGLAADLTKHDLLELVASP